MSNKPQRSNNSRDLYRYASIGSQIMAGLAIAVFLGLKADGRLHTMPLFSCVLPLFILGVIFYKLIRETGNKGNDEPN